MFHFPDSLFHFLRNRCSTSSGFRVPLPPEYPVAEKVGFDRRGNTLYRRSPEGEEIIRTEEELETVIVNGRRITRTLRRKKRIVDDDLPEIAKRYHAFRREHPEPGHEQCSERRA